MRQSSELRIKGWNATEGICEMMSVREFVDQLKKDGYTVKFDTKIKGASGHFHRVDGLAKHQDLGKKLILWLEKRGDAIAEIIETFAIAYDAGAEPCYVIDGNLGEEERKLAELYKLRLLSKGNS